MNVSRQLISLVPTTKLVRTKKVTKNTQKAHPNTDKMVFAKTTRNIEEAIPKINQSKL